MADIPQLTTTDNSQNPRKIPQAIFLENIDQICVKYQVEKVMQSLQEVYNKYKMMEMQILKQKESMQSKIPEIEEAIEIVNFLQQRDSDMHVDFLLTDTIWTKAQIKKDVQREALWLGANVMVEFSYDEATQLLKKNLENATGNFNTFEEDLNFLKDQITTCEVNIARIYNANIKRQQELQKKK
ncbi:von hippel-lindau binding protein 1, putative [Ichthyophthirius multifiliis]|uniref:Prefoldin subunit 3 n=1 Tax=Ichthyophthirius multifiliis TaxID=5932 RepID=G0R4V8_ICHMU|nr:von hippel-lindau binding protein 1, putative [Ichthyophthirius multifiliis]EGR27501.1 von hippel-lindau binding protein 1, putative [Ichthyophthirius multifiliis]|eukprot:XP_004024411.1 von hippel-lindau binding protein 1, putative [Ichthyophthirius multifiliis]